MTSTAPMMSVYALMDPRDASAHYVGVTRQPLARRLIAHRQEAKRRPTSGKAIWLGDLDAAGQQAMPVLLERTTEADAAEAERKWQERLEAAGEPLSNERRAGTGTIHSNRKSRWTPEIEALLGVLPDAHVAALVGATRKAAAYRRQVLGIAPIEEQPTRAPPPWKGGWNKKTLPPECIALMGTIPDAQLAKRFDVSKTRVMRERNERGIPSCAATTGATGRFPVGKPSGRWASRQRP